MNAASRINWPLPGAAGALFTVVIWSALVVASLLMQRGQLDRTAAALARIDAIANLKKDMAIRKWASNVGGVYIREEVVPPFNSLEEAERVTVARSDAEPFRLVAVTPIHLLLAIQQTSQKEFGIRERLTSKQLRNYDNAPDEWESKALETLEKGGDVVAEALPRKGGHGLMRVMVPMRMEDECLECHRDTLVPVGGLRGAASISVDLNAYRTVQEPTWRVIQYWHSGVWVLGVAGILLLHLLARRRAADLARQEEVRRENEMAFSAMAEGAIITDATGTILWVNDAFCRIYGFARDEVIGRNPRMLKSGLHDAGFYAALWRQLQTAGHWRGEIWNRRKSGEAFPEEISIQALRAPDGRVRRYISIFSDITQRKKSEQELATYREHLEELVRQRTEELVVARDQAEAANRSKSMFLANMNHELRTPLNAVIGFSQLMERDASLSPAQQRHLEIINLSGRHLLTLINDILELSKIESGKMTMSVEETDPARLLDAVVGMMRLRAEESGLSLGLDSDGLPPAVALDPLMLRQVLLNLLSNAVKFTPRGGSIVVRARAEPDGDGFCRLVLAVSDTGVGIAAADRERIFSSFEQVGHVRQGGTGLGLTISREYVRMMGGELAVDSTPGKGSTFRFSIRVPCSGQPQAPDAACRAALPAGAGRRVLVVDDVPEARLLVRSLLEPLAFAVAEAASLAEARAAIAADPPDLVLLDWFLSDGLGIDLVRETAERRRDGRPPRVAMLTANALDESRAAALAAGADAFLSKPFEEGELYRVIESLLGVAPATAAVAAEAPLPALAALPAAARERLVQAAVSLDPERIAAALAALADEQPALAAQLSEICRCRHYHALWQMLGIYDQEA